MLTLDSPRVAGLLERLYSEARRDRNRTALAIAPEVGRLLYLLVRTRRPSLVIEFGTSLGVSAIYIAAALRDNDAGRLITTEQSIDKALRAAQHFEEAGLSRRIELRHGDALETLRNVEGVDMLFLDGLKSLYLPLLQALEPSMSGGCLVVADDVISQSTTLKSYLQYVRNEASGYASSEIPLDDGLELSLRDDKAQKPDLPFSKA